MMADVGGIVNVRGSRIATPLAPPSPGSTPMMVPSTMPTTAITRLKGVMAIWNPRSRCSNPLMARSVPEPAFERPLRQRHQEPHLEDEEGHHRDPDRYDGRRGPPVSADPAHVGGQVDGSAHVQPDQMSEDDHRDRRKEHRRHRAKLPWPDERPAGTPADRQRDDEQCGDGQRHTQVEDE